MNTNQSNRPFILEQLHDIPQVEVPENLDNLVFAKLDKKIAAEQRRSPSFIRRYSHWFVAASVLLVIAFSFHLAQRLAYPDASEPQNMAKVSEAELFNKVDATLSFFFSNISDSQQQTEQAINSLMSPDDASLL